MLQLFFILLFIGVATIAIKLWALPIEPGPGTTFRKVPPRYLLVGSIYTPAELRFLNTLRTATFEDTEIVAKIRLADLFDVNRSLDRSQFSAAFNQIKAKHVDFLIVRIADGKPIAAVELDDRSHNRADRIARDGFVNELFTAAGLPLIRFRVQATYDRALVQRALIAGIGSEHMV